MSYGPFGPVPESHEDQEKECTAMIITFFACLAFLGLLYLGIGWLKSHGLM